MFTERKLIFRLSILIFGLLLSACQSQPAQEVKNFPLDEVWTFSSDNNIVAPPRQYEELLILKTRSGRLNWGQTFYGLDAKAGTSHWSIDAGRYGYYEFGWELSNELLVLAGNGVKAINPETNQIAWQNKFSGAPLAVLIIQNTVFVAGGRQVVRAFDLATGEKKWSNSSFGCCMRRLFVDESAQELFTVSDKSYIFDADNGEILKTSTLEITCSRLHLRMSQGRLYCTSQVFDPLTGALLADSKNDGNDYRHDPVIMGNTIYFLTLAGRIKALDLESSKLMWESHAQNEESSSNPDMLTNLALLDGRGYAIASDATLRAIDLTTGQEIGWWQGPEPPRFSRGAFSVISDGERLYATFGGNTIHAFEPKEP